MGPQNGESVVRDDRKPDGWGTGHLTDEQIQEVLKRTAATMPDLPTLADKYLSDIGIIGLDPSELPVDEEDDDPNDPWFGPGAER